MSNYINVKLRDGKDNDLKEWYNSLPKGIKSYVVREALREFKNNKDNILAINDQNTNQNAKEKQIIKKSMESEEEQENINEKSQKEMEQKNNLLINNFID